MENVNLFVYSEDALEDQVEVLISDLIDALRGAQRELGVSNATFARKLGVTLANWDSIKSSDGPRKLQLKTLARICAHARDAELAAVQDLALRAAKITLAARALNAGLLDAHTYRLLLKAEVIRNAR